MSDGESATGRALIAEAARAMPPAALAALRARRAEGGDLWGEEIDALLAAAAEGEP